MKTSRIIIDEQLTKQYEIRENFIDLLIANIYNYKYD